MRPHIELFRSYAALPVLAGLLLTLQLAGGELIDAWSSNAVLRDPSWVELFFWQLMHTGFLHLGLNLAGLGLLLVIHPNGLRGWWWAARMLACGWVGNLLFLLINGLSADGSVHIALGLSGALHALAWMLAMDCLRQPHGKALLGLLLIKLAYEQVWGAMPFSSLVGITVLVDVHLYAVIGAVWLGVFLRVLRRDNHPTA